MFTIFKKEINLFFSSAVGYIVVLIFILATALMLWVLPGEYNVLNSGYANLDGLFVMAPWLYLFLCPAVTMKMFAEERSLGTIELLLTRPISRWSVVSGKFFAAWTLVFFSLLPAIVWYVSVYFLSDPVGNVDSAAFWGSWIGLLLLAMLYAAIGLFGSSVSKNQIVAFVVSALLSSLIFFGFDMVGSMFSAEISYFMQICGAKYHYSSMARGVIDSRDVIYFTAVSALFLWLAKKNN